MGRSIPQPINFSPSGPLPAASTSSCPTGGLPVVGAYAWNLPGINGGMMTYTFCTATITLSDSPGSYLCAATCPNQPLVKTLIQSIILPNNTAWNFEYDGIGDLTQITFPTGGTISYAYGGSAVCPPVSSSRYPSRVPSVSSRTVNANDGTGPHTWTYGLPQLGPLNMYGSPTSFVVSVTDPLANVTTHTQTALGGFCTFNETEVARYNGAVGHPPPPPLLE